MARNATQNDDAQTTTDGGYCFEETTVDGETVECERPPDHDGDHAGHIPGDAPGLTWDLYEWSDDEDEDPEVRTDGGQDRQTIACAECGREVPREEAGVTHVVVTEEVVVEPSPYNRKDPRYNPTTEERPVGTSPVPACSDCSDDS